MVERSNKCTLPVFSVIPIRTLWMIVKVIFIFFFLCIYFPKPDFIVRIKLRIFFKTLQKCSSLFKIKNICKKGERIVAQHIIKLQQLKQCTIGIKIDLWNSIGFLEWMLFKGWTYIVKGSSYIHREGKDYCLNLARNIGL